MFPKTWHACIENRNANRPLSDAIGFPNCLNWLANVLPWRSRALPGIRPDKSLSPWVKCFWLLEDVPAPDSPMDAVVPDGCPEIIVHYGDRFTEDVAQRRVCQPDVIVAGQLTRPLLLRPTGRVGM